MENRKTIGFGGTSHKARKTLTGGTRKSMQRDSNVKRGGKGTKTIPKQYSTKQFLKKLKEEIIEFLELTEEDGA
jgi:hypothetical protein